jgi:hypothetical protein
LLISAVVTDAGNSQIPAIAKISTPAGGTRVVLAAMPADANALTIVPGGNAGAELVNNAHHFVSWDTGVLNAWW